MAQPEQVVEDRRRQVALLAQLAQRTRPVPFGKRRTVISHDQGHVAVGRRLQAQRGGQQQLARGVGQMILAPQHDGHTHQRVVEHVAEEERRAAVGAAHHEVADVGTGEVLVTVHEVLEADATGCRHPEPQSRPPPFCLALATLCGSELAAGAGVARRPTGGGLRPPAQVELQRAAITGIHSPQGLETIKRRRVVRTARRLFVRGRRTSAAGALVPGEAQPGQILDERGDELRPAALCVGVLDAQQEAATVAARQQPVEQRGTRVTEVQLPRGTGREPRYDRRS